MAARSTADYRVDKHQLSDQIRRSWFDWNTNVPISSDGQIPILQITMTRLRAAGVRI